MAKATKRKRSNMAEIFESIVVHKDLLAYGVDTSRKQRISTVATSRKYVVEFVRDAKNIATGWLKAFSLENAIGFGLPEVDDRYHVWRVPFDLGFIGLGNPEITKDKVSRFERNLEINKQTYHSATCIIVDRVGEGSGLLEQAKRAEARVIQMSMSYWPIELAKWLSTQFEYESDIAHCKTTEFPILLKKKLAAISFENFVRGLTVSEEEEDD